MSYDKVAQKITDAVLQQLAQGKVPWKQPWSEISSPFNLRSGKRYRGMNQFLLGCVEDNPTGAFLTLAQGKELGGKLRKGSKGWPVIFWKLLGEQRDEAARVTEKGVPFVNYSHVFPITNFDELDLRKLPEPPEPLDLRPSQQAEALLAGITPQPQYRLGTAASYSPGRDTVTMPDIFMFHTNEGYYSTLFHELGHWTGHASRLNREGITTPTRFGSKLYALEELVAEMTAGLLCARCHINQPLDQTASYLAGWVSKLQEHPRLLLDASGKAQKAADFLLGGAAAAPLPEPEPAAAEPVAEVVFPW